MTLGLLERSVVANEHALRAHVFLPQPKPSPMALMVDKANNYLGGAFITNRRIKERLLARVRAKSGPLPKGLKAKPDAQWLKPGTIATVRHLRGEDDLRHASVQDLSISYRANIASPSSRFRNTTSARERACCGNSPSFPIPCIRRARSSGHRGRQALDAAQERQPTAIKSRRSSFHIRHFASLKQRSRRPYSPTPDWLLGSRQ